MIKVNKPIQLVLIILILSGGLYFAVENINEKQKGEEAQKIAKKANKNNSRKEESEKKKSEEFRSAKPIVNPAGFLNTDKVSIEDNIGDKVILLDMWTYSCINCQRTLPYLVEWHKKYKDDGLLIIGNHAPEFDFEKDRKNVEEAVEKFNIKYPVVLDNNFGTWNAYNNQYWPQKYLIGADGYIRYEHIGEGKYKETEQKIVELLEELKQKKGLPPKVDKDSEPNKSEK